MDARKKKVLTVLCIGSVILVWRGYALISTYMPASALAESNASPVQPVTPQAVATRQTQDMALLWEKQRIVAAQPWGRNPYADPPWAARSSVGQTGPVKVQAVGVPPASPIKFVGVSRSGDQWLAAVQGNIVRVGDVVAKAYKVVKITQHSITLESAGWQFTYQIGSEEAVVRGPPKVQ